MNPKKDFIKALRDLAEKIDQGELLVIDSISTGIDFEKTVVHMIETYPEVWGKGGIMRPWLERWATEHGIDGDFGLPSDVGFDGKITE